MIINDRTGRPTLGQIFRCANKVYQANSVNYPIEGIGGLGYGSGEKHKEFLMYLTFFIVLAWHYEFSNDDIRRYVTIQRMGTGSSRFAEITKDPYKAGLFKEINNEIKVLK